MGFGNLAALGQATLLKLGAAERKPDHQARKVVFKGSPH